jgi:hypothetical protein
MPRKPMMADLIAEARTQLDQAQALIAQGMAAMAEAQPLLIRGLLMLRGAEAAGRSGLGGVDAATRKRVAVAGAAAAWREGKPGKGPGRGYRRTPGAEGRSGAPAPRVRVVPRGTSGRDGNGD